VRAELLVLGRAVALAFFLGAGFDLTGHASADIGQAGRIGIRFEFAVADAIDNAIRASSSTSALKGTVVGIGSMS